eukprot:6838289-Alexandrium_andersonii.AAC.1
MAWTPIGRKQTANNKPPTTHRCTALHNSALFCAVQLPAVACAGGLLRPPGAGSCGGAADPTAQETA